APSLLTWQAICRDHNQAIHDYLGFWRDSSNPNFYFSLHVNAHPPTSVFLAVPFAWMDYQTAFLVWNLVSLLLFAGTVALVVRQLGLSVTLPAAAVAFVLLVQCSPLRAQLMQGHLNPVLLALITGAWAAERSNRPGWAGVLLGLATAIKLFPGFLLVYYAIRGRWRVVFSGAMSFVLCTAVTLLVVGL